ncbi:MAG: hypothetical protein ACFE9C_04595 [Candidatus Hodarchaeota archaeon]
MPDKKVDASRTKDLEKDEEKILYGDNKTVCFACGEEIDNNTNVCPYCNTSVK